eukprot:132583-Ditylum_brightwellii.AAC.1
MSSQEPQSLENSFCQMSFGSSSQVFSLPPPMFSNRSIIPPNSYYNVPDDVNYILGNGSAENPYILKASPDFPEHHMRFQLIFVPKVLNNGYEYNVLDNSTDIELGDANDWDARLNFDRIPVNITIVLF